MEFIKLNIQLFAGDISDNEKLTSTGGNYGYLKASFEEVADSVNTNTNKNKVKAKATLTQKTGSWAKMYTPLLEIWWYDNNKNKSGVKVATTEVSKLSSGDVKIAEGTIEVEHLSDGSLKGYAKAKWLQKVNNRLIYEDGEVSTDNIPLTTIPRANTFKSVPDSANVGQGFTVALDQKSSSFSTKLVCTCNGKSEEIETTTNSAVFFLPKATFASAFGSKESKKTATITATTYNGTTQIGDPVTDTIVLHLLESDYEPVVSISAVDSNTTTKTLTGDTTGRTCVLNASTMTCTVSAAAQNNATLSSVTINGASVATTTKTYTINNPTTNTFTIVAKDSRGFSNEAYDTLPNPISYFKPTVTANFKRNTPTDGKVKLTYSGKIFNKSFGAKSNECKFYYDYKLKSASSYTSVELKPTISGDTFSGSLTLPETFDYQQNYSFRLRVVDSLNTVVYAQDVAKGEPVLWWNENSVNVNGTLKGKMQNTDSGCVSSAGVAMSSYWYKVWDATITHRQYNDFSCTLQTNDRYSVQWGTIGFGIRQEGANGGGAYAFSVNLKRISGNVPLSRLRLYYNNTTGYCALWVDCYNQWGCFPYKIVGKNDRTSAETASIPGTFYHGSNSSVQTLPSSSYITMTDALDKVGDLSTLTTTDKTNVVSAINEVNSVNAMTIGLNANKSMTMSSVWSYQKIALDTVDKSTGSKLTFTSNSVKIGAGVKYVRVSANAMTSGIASEQIVILALNGVTISQGYYRATNTNYWGTLALTPKVIPVSEGDLIDLRCGAGATGTVTIAGRTFTYLTVEVVG